MQVEPSTEALLPETDAAPRSSRTPQLATDDGNPVAQAFAVAMARVAWDTKAEDILVLNVEPLVNWCAWVLSAPPLHSCVNTF